MTGFEIGAISVATIVALIYLGMHVPVALASVSFVGVWIVTSKFDVAVNLLWLAASRTVASYVFGVIPLFVLMGLLVSAAGMGRDAYDVAQYMLKKVRGGLGMATVAANAIFAAITGVSIASATIFTRLSVPEMIRFGYSPRFAVGVVAGSSVLGMLIPPSVLLILYALIAEQSVGDMFIAGIGPGILLSIAYCVLIYLMIRFVPSAVAGADGIEGLSEVPSVDMTLGDFIRKSAPISLLVLIVLGGIYGGFSTPTEAGAIGALAALGFALWRRALTFRIFWDILRDAGRISASLLFIVVCASMYARMLGISGLPTQLSNWILTLDVGLAILLLVYIVILLLLGTIIDSVSIILIMVPLYLTVLAPFDVNLVWFGIVTIIAVEIGLLTPPLGLAVYVIKSSMEDNVVSLGDIFRGALPFAATMLAVLLLILAFDEIALFLVELRR